MYARRNRRRGARKVTRRPRKYVKKSVRPSKLLKKTIQSMISKNVEDKQAYYSTGDSLVNFNSGINSTGDVLSVLPDIPEGVGVNARIGDTIRAKSLVIRGYIQLKATQAGVYNDFSNARIAVRLLCVSSKKVKNFNDLKSQAGSNLIQKGGSSTTFSGYLSDIYAPLNTEAYTKHFDKVFYLSQPATLQQVAGTSTTFIWSNDLSKTVRFFTIKIPMRGKQLMFDDGTSSYLPTNFGPGIMLGYAKMDGSTPDTVSTNVGICYDVDFRYEDA